MPQSLAAYVAPREKQLKKSSRFWLNIRTCFLCCFDATMAYRTTALSAVPTTPITRTVHTHTRTHTHTRLTALCPGLPAWAGTRKVKPIWILLKQETVSGSGISWAIMQVCTSLQTDNHASTPPLSFYRPDVLPAAQPTASKHCRQKALKATTRTVHSK